MKNICFLLMLVVVMLCSFSCVRHVAGVWIDYDVTSIVVLHEEEPLVIEVDNDSVPVYENDKILITFELNSKFIVLFNKTKQPIKVLGTDLTIASNSMSYNTSELYLSKVILPDSSITIEYFPRNIFDQEYTLEQFKNVFREDLVEEGQDGRKTLNTYYYESDWDRFLPDIIKMLNEKYKDGVQIYIPIEYMHDNIQDYLWFILKVNAKKDRYY